MSLAEKGNLQLIKSDSTYRKIKSEVNSQLDRDKNDIVDIIKMQETHSNYIREITIPFTVKLFSTEQLLIAHKSYNTSSLPLLYFDATGGIVRNPIDKKRVFLYSGIIQVPGTNRLCSVLDMISAHHFAKTIFKILYDFRVFCEENNKWPVFCGVVTDFSFANIHAITLAFNRLTLMDYLKTCLDLLANHSNIDQIQIVKIHLCCAHFIKIIVKDLEKHYEAGDDRDFIRCVMISHISKLCIIITF